MPDAVVVGAGPNGLVAANLLVDAGWDVDVVEAQPDPGGAVGSAELTRPGFVHDLFSAFYPLAAASPAIARLDLERYGLAWQRSDLVLANPRPSGSCPILAMDAEVTARALDEESPGDGGAWLDLFSMWERVGDRLLPALLEPFPPIGVAARLAARLGPRDLARFARFLTLPVRRLSEERFGGDGAGLLLAGSALHSDLAPSSALSGFYGWFLCCLGHDVGWPAPRGGARALTDALVQRLVERGGRLTCDARVERVVVRSGRAVAVETGDGRSWSAAHAVLADVGAPALFGDLVGRDHLPPSFLADLDNFQYDSGTIKLDWALGAPIPWEAEDARRAGTVHLARDMDHLTQFGAQLEMGLVPDRPFVVLGQMTTTDPTRSPAGTETAWAYTHVPQEVRGDAGGKITGAWTADELEEIAARIEEEIESLAPGFRSLILERHVMGPHEMQARDANLVGGAINGGTAQLHQQLIFRPTPGLARATTPIANLYLASASAHPGGGVHGAPGANAAAAALARRRRRRLLMPLATIGGAAALLRKRT